MSCPKQECLIDAWSCKPAPGAVDTSEGLLHAKLKASEVICTYPPVQEDFKFAQLMHLGFRLKKARIKSTWTRTELTKLVEGCMALEQGSAARSEPINDWFYYLSTYWFGGAKTVDDVAAQVHKLYLASQRDAPVPSSL